MMLLFWPGKQCPRVCDFHTNSRVLLFVWYTNCDEDSLLKVLLTSTVTAEIAVIFFTWSATIFSYPMVFKWYCQTLVCVSKTPSYTVSTSLYCSHKSWWSHRFMLFMPTSQPTISMLEQKPGLWWSHVCCCLIIFFLAYLAWSSPAVHLLQHVKSCLFWCSAPRHFFYCLQTCFPTCWVEYISPFSSDLTFLPLWWQLTGCFLAVCTVVGEHLVL